MAGVKKMSYQKDGSDSLFCVEVQPASRKAVLISL